MYTVPSGKKIAAPIQAESTTNSLQLSHESVGVGGVCSKVRGLQAFYQSSNKVQKKCYNLTCFPHPVEELGSWTVLSFRADATPCAGD